MATMQRTSIIHPSAKEGDGPSHSHQESSDSSGLNASTSVNENARPLTFGGVTFGGDVAPGIYTAPLRKFANPAPLGLSAFALTTFVLSLVNMRTRGVTKPNLVVSLAYGYGGLLQFISGMWEIVVGNTFAATAMASYGGFWIAFAIILTPGFQVESSLGASSPDYINSLGFFLIAWFIFTTILLLCTIRTTITLFVVIFLLDMTFFLLAVGYLHNDNGLPREAWIKAGGWAGLLTSFAAWYAALAGLLDKSNSFFTLPVGHFPWSPQAQEERAKTEREMA